MNNYYFGHFAEDVALWYLRLKGYHKVAKNYVTGRGTGAGEVDLILKKGNTLVFAEVKKRPTITQARYAIDGQSQTRIVRASAVFLARHPFYQTCAIRYDAIVYGHSLWPTHIPNAWQVL